MKTELEEQMGEIKTEILQTHVYNICTFNRNYMDIGGLNNCLLYIKSQVKNCSAIIKEQEYEYEGNKYKNLVLTFGKGNSKIVLGAHYDTYGGSVGADDNASSCAFLIEMANLLTDQDIEIVFFTLEEPPIFGSEYMGSYVYANTTGEKRIKLMMNFEMLGYYDAGVMSKVDVGIYNNKDIIEFTQDFLSSNFVVMDCTNKPTYRNAADHIWFYPNQIPTMIFSAAGPKNLNYHMPTDTPDTLDYKIMTERCNKIARYILEVSNGKNKDKK